MGEDGDESALQEIFAREEQALKPKGPADGGRRRDSQTEYAPEDRGLAAPKGAACRR